MYKREEMVKQIARAKRWLERAAEQCEKGSVEAGVGQLELARAEIDVARTGFWENGSVSSSSALSRGLNVIVFCLLLIFVTPSTIDKNSGKPSVLSKNNSEKSVFISPMMDMEIGKAFIQTRKAPVKVSSNEAVGTVIKVEKEIKYKETVKAENKSDKFDGSLAEEPGVDDVLDLVRMAEKELLKGKGEIMVVVEEKKNDRGVLTQ